MIKAAFFDIDGTLLSFKTHQVSAGTVRAFDYLHQKNVLTFIATGRPMVLIPDMPVSFSGYVTMNGGYCFMGDKVLARMPIKIEESDRWLLHVKQNNRCTMIFTEHEMFCNNIQDSVGCLIQQQLEFTMPPYLPIDEMMGKEVFQIIAIQPPEEDQYLRELMPSCSYPRWSPLFTDVVCGGNSKAVGIAHVIEQLGIRPEECICFGDGGNDLEMLDFCGIGVAMGNANDEVKSHANYVTTSVDEEGIEHAVMELIK